MGWQPTESREAKELKLLRALARDVRKFFDYGSSRNIEAMKEALMAYENRDNREIIHPFASER